jgi:hypothetical protein
MREPISRAEPRDIWAHQTLDNVLGTDPNDGGAYERIKRWRAEVKTQLRSTTGAGRASRTALGTRRLAGCDSASVMMCRWRRRRRLFTGR